MKLKGVIVDADFCIKVGASPKYRYLERVLPELADKIYIHRVVYNEILIPVCAKEQIDSLIIQGKLKICCAIFQAILQMKRGLRVIIPKRDSAITEYQTEFINLNTAYPIKAFLIMTIGRG